MRVIGGSARGRKLRAPTGRSIRPTTDRVREALFDLIGPSGPGERVLDLYAGTGALGIEAISRGAVEVVFVDRDAKAVELVRTNLTTCGFMAQAQVERCPVQRYLGRGPREPFDLILLDPPYGADDLKADLALLGQRGWLVEAGRIFVETDAPRILDQAYGILQAGRTRRYGDTALHEFLPGGAPVDKPAHIR